MITPVVYVFQLDEDGAGEEMDGDEDIATYKEWPLPAREFHGLWESLVFDDEEGGDGEVDDVRLNVCDQIRLCRRVDPETQKWWARQDSITWWHATDRDSQIKDMLRALASNL